MWLSTLPHLVWYQWALTPIPAVAQLTLEALDRCTPVAVTVCERPPTVTIPAP
jgi:hypothetical protein